MAGPTGTRQFKNSALGISFWAPANYTLIGDPADLKKLMDKAGQVVSMPSNLMKQALDGIQFMCVQVRGSGATVSNDILLLAVERLSSNSVSKQEYLAANMQGTVATFPGTRMVGAPTPTKVGGLTSSASSIFVPIQTAADGSANFWWLWTVAAVMSCKLLLRTRPDWLNWKCCFPT